MVDFILCLLLCHVGLHDGTNAAKKQLISLLSVSNVPIIIRIVSVGCQPFQIRYLFGAELLQK